MTDKDPKMIALTKLSAVACATASLVLGSIPAFAENYRSAMADVVRFVDKAETYAADGFKSDEIDHLWTVSTRLTAQIDGLIAQIDGVVGGGSTERALCNNEVIEGLQSAQDGLQRLRSGVLAADGFLIIVTGLKDTAQSCAAS